MNLSSARVIILNLLASIVVGSAAGFGSASYALLQARHKQDGSAATPVPATIADDPAQDRVTIGVVERTSAAVVSITISKELSSDFFNQLFPPPSPALPPLRHAMPDAALDKQPVGAGSGFLVSDDGLIVTNKHVVADPAADYTVNLQDGRSFRATVLALDPVLDLAVIKIDAQRLPHLELGNSDNVRIGETVVAIGNALAQFQNTVTKGIVSGVNRHLVAGGDWNGSEIIEGALQTDAAINPGNSGGPLIDLAGRVIGINTAISENAQSVGFALPSNLVKRALDSVRKHGRIQRPWLGVRYIPLNAAQAKKNHLPISAGAWIVKGNASSDAAVLTGSPAEKAGLKEQDVILSVNDQVVSDDHSLSSLLDEHAPGDTIRLKIWRAGKNMEFSLVLDERKP